MSERMLAILFSWPVYGMGICLLVFCFLHFICEPWLFKVKDAIQKELESEGEAKNFFEIVESVKLPVKRLFLLGLACVGLTIYIGYGSLYSPGMTTGTTAIDKRDKAVNERLNKEVIVPDLKEPTLQERSRKAAQEAEEQRQRAIENFNKLPDHPERKN